VTADPRLATIPCEEAMTDRQYTHPAPPLLQVENLSKHFSVRHGAFSGAGPTLAAVDRVSLTMGEGVIFGLAGESGSGKSTLGRAILQLVKADSGRVLYRGQDLAKLGSRAMREVRQRIQIIFQDPAAALSPRRTIRQSLLEPLDLFGIGAPAERTALAIDALHTVGMDGDALPRLPHQFSSGQRQRIGIARALLTEPELVIADEAVSALDVSVQAQILELVVQLRRERGIAFLFISHDLAVIRQVADVVGIIYRGQLLETAPCEQLFATPLHPYTRQLLASVPDPDPAAHRESLDPAAGLLREAAGRGCVFARRCPDAMPHCRRNEPAASAPVSGRPHRVKCHLYSDGD
jgi:oligopeptide/dipeptide ABC transporter ATP-binding protein